MLPLDDQYEREQQALLARLDAVAEADPETASPSFRRFLRAYYETAAPESLVLRDEARLVAIAARHRALAEQRAPDDIRLRLQVPDASQRVAAIDTVMADQPFLVDTLTIAIRNAGALIDWSVHPVIPIARAADGRFREVEPGAPAESLIRIEFAPLASETAYAQLEADCRRALGEARIVCADFRPCLERTRALAESLATPPPDGRPAEYAEARAFLEWLCDHHFTFLGLVDADAECDAAGRPHFIRVPGSGLGLLRDGSPWADEELIAPQAELDKYADSTRLVVVTKANRRATIHRAEPMDVISVKRFAPDGRLLGTTRLLGLFSTEAWIDRPRDIPLIRRKAEYVVARSRLGEHSHSGKKLRDILHGLPRDELFQSSEEELFRLCLGIRALRDRHSLRLFMRRDRYGRFYSFLVYVPRERYSRELRDKVGQALMAICDGQALDRNVEAVRGELTRLHLVVRTAPGTTIRFSQQAVEAQVIAATRTWREQLREALAASPALAGRYGDAFPPEYAEIASAAAAADDAAVLARLDDGQPLAVRLGFEPQAEGQLLPTTLKLYAQPAPIALSDVLPTLEHFGLRIVRQDPIAIQPKDGPAQSIQIFDIRHGGCAGPAAAVQARFEEALLAAIQGQADSDGLNRLVLDAGLDLRRIGWLRALARYLLQTGLPFSQPYLEALLAAHAAIVGDALALFEARFDPALDSATRDARSEALRASLKTALDAVTSLDADRALRALVAVIEACLRTNAWQRDADGRRKRWLSFKLDPTRVPELPKPRPAFEIWVHAPEVEGVHLRGGKVARGGLRWSDRPQDFRTEVLGLMKAQQVKNTVIVPVGAKGGFVVRRPVDSGDRDAWLAQGVACYQTFLRGLLDVTDNRVGGRIVPPPDVVRHDDDDPYLVVAADKGTATFSDHANAVAAEYGFWLGDAFASGGSAGYDHKKMGITARGAWESVKRHFREMTPGRDIQREPFTVVGIGDMSGDVFGNGMRLSAQIHLVAAFDHRHIFLDPDPDPVRSAAERERLFHLPRSSWADYDPACLSPGGGVFPRSAKRVPLSPQVRARLGIEADALTPDALLRAILTAPVDLLWNGGIGTYVKASHESHADVRDRANDAIRVNGRELRCRVVGEGGNLGCTQAGRIEYALSGGGGHGGRINTDAIDNAGGVHTSDREVNIKIALSEATTSGALAPAARSALLASLTDDIAAFVLRDNAVQSLAISLLEHTAASRLGDHAELIRMLEREGRLDRALEGLPDDDTLQRRRAAGQGLTRPELAVLIAYSKLSLYDAVLASGVPDDPFLLGDLLANFPPVLVEGHREALERHQLRREIVATILANALVNRMGAGFAQLWADDHGHDRAEVLKAYPVAHRIVDGDRYWRAIEALDLQVPAATQLQLMHQAIGLLKHATGWLAASRWRERPMAEAVAAFGAAFTELEAALPALLPASYRDERDRAEAAMRAAGVPEALGALLANTRVLGAAFDITELARDAGVPLTFAAETYFRLGEALRVPWLFAAVNELPTVGRWQSLSRVQLRDELWRAHRRITAAALAAGEGEPQARVAAWLAAQARATTAAQARLGELQADGQRDVAALSVGIRELALLA